MACILLGLLQRKLLPAGALAAVAVLVLAFRHPPVASLSFTSPAYTSTAMPPDVPIPAEIQTPTVTSLPAPFGVWVWGDLNGPACLDHAGDVGARWIRWPLLWSRVESTPDQYNWSYVDAQITNANQAGINLLVNITGNPSWAATYQQGPLNDNADLVEFVGAAVERYDGDGFDDAPGSPVVRYWQFYNEPDNSRESLAEQATHGFWGYDGAGYAQMLAAVYPEVKKASPAAQVVIGGLAYDAFVEDGGPFVRRFLDDVLQNNGGHYFDVMAFHYYLETWNAYGPGIAGKAVYLRNKLAEYGLSKPMFCTETGRHVHDWSNEEMQSLFVVKTFVQGMSVDLGVIIWFTLVDLNPEYDYGLLKQDISPKPSYDVYKTLTAQLSNAHYERRLTDEETGAPDVEGYLFQAPGKVIRVVWTTGVETRTMRIAASQVDQVDKSGPVTSLYDADDGTNDGIVSISVGPSPVYLVTGGGEEG